MLRARESLSEFLQPTGLRCPYDLFTNGWPAKVDRQTIDGIDGALESKLQAETSDHLVSMAQQLGPLKPLCEQAILCMIETDQWLSVARWAHQDNCTMPQWADHGIWLKNGRHVLLGVEQVLEERLVLPDHAGGLVGGGVGVSIGETRLASEEAVPVGLEKGKRRGRELEKVKEF